MTIHIQMKNKNIKIIQYCNFTTPFANYISVDQQTKYKHHVYETYHIVVVSLDRTTISYYIGTCQMSGHLFY